MRVLILTETSLGTAAHHLPWLINHPGIEVVQVIRSRGLKKSRKKFWIKKIRKAFAIGPLGVLNGIRMRKWFGPALEARLSLVPIELQCKEAHIPYAEVAITNSEETIGLFRQAKATLGISLGNSFISPKLFNIPEKGMINIHHEILPDYQNAQSIIWQLYNNSASTGYTIHQITKRIDQGAILYQEHIPIVFGANLPETIAATLEALLKASARGLVTLLDNYAALAPNAKAQGAGKSYTTPTYGQYQRILRNHNKLRSRQ